MALYRRARRADTAPGVALLRRSSHLEHDPEPSSAEQKWEPVFAALTFGSDKIMLKMSEIAFQTKDLHGRSVQFR
ncbi:hypothetical protein MPL3356_280116 [Mesorhizobium plurifarium]|uniref:Uncharacterized protein n=1 Tax=Mesorhizobium plurifarium TaxID=69974 RepID=A0A090FIA9_MESPL|nr:hypothetical protein MPL3356_280116 [Mesorhizobium plurifarium]CDX55076.1 hypothetical protein MPL1032_190400 [Mesorhizobium plurifarium]